MSRNPSFRAWWFLLWIAISVLAFRSPLRTLLNLSLDDERYSYIGLMPVAAFALLYRARAAILPKARYCPLFALPAAILGALLAARTLPFAAFPGEDLLPALCGVVLVWISGFVLFFGLSAVPAAAFPLALLLLTIPLPVALLERAISLLQYNSAVVSGALFRILGVPALRQELTISLPGFDIEIAPQCSGIRSTTALILATGVAGYVLLRDPLSKIFLVFVTVPLVILKNALRIVTLSTLAVYVNRGFLFGRLHRYGGLCFSLLDLAILLPLLFYLLGVEARRRQRRPLNAGEPSLLLH